MVEEPPLRDLRLGTVSRDHSAGWAKFFHSNRARNKLCRRQCSRFGRRHIAQAGVIRFSRVEILMGNRRKTFTFCHTVTAMRLVLCICAILLAVPRLPAQRLVFAHYMLTNQDYQGDSDPTQELKIASYEREILEAQAIGIDGFALNAGGWLHQSYYIRYAAQMFEAAI